MISVFNLADNSKPTQRELDYLKEIVKKVTRWWWLRFIRLVNLMAAKFHMDQTAFHWRIFTDTCLIMLCLCLPMFALLYSSTFFKQKNNHVYSKDHTQQKRELQGFQVSQCTEEQTSFELSKLLKTKETLNDLEMLCNTSVLEAWRHYLITKPLVQWALRSK